LKKVTFIPTGTEVGRWGKPIEKRFLRSQDMLQLAAARENRRFNKSLKLYIEMVLDVSFVFGARSELKAVQNTCFLGSPLFFSDRANCSDLPIK